ncbi:DUF3775 domain-containing protein [Breoghania sp.]|uniref:DUF3775 domain-containing protein n=1 Tax=Breoghania sp. TaxID=2065378 RepID=UPI0026202A00|nr:DUF3775 domain-containing protein [Breoghania sp.]MDJ0932963.1 DUF3775 domain-containing protein [Breoghania sp.]
MTKRSPQTDNDRPDLSIPLETACYIAFKARELDDKDDGSSENGSGPDNDNAMDVIDEGGEDPTLEELTSLIENLTVDAQIDLVALMWLGRGGLHHG